MYSELSRGTQIAFYDEKYKVEEIFYLEKNGQEYYLIRNKMKN